MNNHLCEIIRGTYIMAQNALDKIAEHPEMMIAAGVLMGLGITEGIIKYSRLNEKEHKKLLNYFNEI